MPPVGEKKTSTPVQAGKLQAKSSTVSNFDSHLDLTSSTDGGWEKNNLQNLNVTDFSGSDTSFSHGEAKMVVFKV